MIGVAAAGACLAALGGALFVYATRVEPYWLAVRRLTVPVPGLSAAWDGLTVLHLSDLHSRPNERRSAAVAASAARIPADVIAITGDFGDRPVYTAAAAAPLLRRRRGRLGTFAVLGNHDLDATPWRRSHHRHSTRVGNRVAGWLAGSGITVLRNQNTYLERGGDRLWIVGVDDPHTFHDDLPRAFCGVPAGASAIVLAHSWEPAPLAAELGACLFLAGHSHGGQVRPPFLSAPVHNTHRRPPQTVGLFWLNGTAIHLSPGLGGQHALRFLVRPQATLLTLRPG